MQFVAMLRKIAVLDSKLEQGLSVRVFAVCSDAEEHHHLPATVCVRACVSVGLSVCVCVQFVAMLGNIAVLYSKSKQCLSVHVC